MRGGRTDWSKSKNVSSKRLSLTGSPVCSLRKQNCSSTYVSSRPCPFFGPSRLISARPLAVSVLILALLTAYGLRFSTRMSKGTPAFVVPTFL